MDPDMVRQQEEAEREALALLARKPPAPAPIVAAPIPQKEASQLETASFAEPVLAVIAPAPEPVSLQKRMPAKRKKRSLAGALGQFVSFALAGAMAGGGLGIVAANSLQLPAQEAQLAIFGPAAFMAAACAMASLFTGQPDS